ncbi:hypothetical protein BDD12DRAFT_981376 [Trichophaea hybrida]|nr:hypothetical protein BDD12DRAFT_981376 [Trichophaea hybrida]
MALAQRRYTPSDRSASPAAFDPGFLATRLDDNTSSVRRRSEYSRLWIHLTAHDSSPRAIAVSKGTLSDYESLMAIVQVILGLPDVVRNPRVYIQDRRDDGDAPLQFDLYPDAWPRSRAEGISWDQHNQEQVKNHVLHSLRRDFLPELRNEAVVIDAAIVGKPESLQTGDFIPHGRDVICDVTVIDA